MKKIFIILFSFVILLVGWKNKKSEYNKEKLKIIKKEDKLYPITPIKTINIIFMLPLFFSSSSTEMNQENKKLSDHAISFYIGAKTAIDFICSSLELNKKKKINIKIFDTKNEKKRIINFIHSYDLSKIHAIIGPFFRSSLEEVAKNNKKIPIISPFISSDDLDNYPNIIQSETKNVYLIEPILEEIKILNQKEKIKTLYLLGEDPSKKITNFVKKKLLQWNLHIQIFFQKKNFSHIIITKDVPFFAVFLGGNSSLGEKFIEFIQRFPEKKIIPFGIGYNNVYYKNVSFLKKYKFLFTTKYHFNQNDEKKRKMFFLIRKKLGFDLNKYQLFGFDLSYDILYKLIENNNLFEIIDKKSFSGLISKYKYEKISPNGGYFNKGLWIIRLH
ncbi:hypothetical protein [Blattabacterium sp. (Blaberus giganteus)]|uniref:hypothetical protein n=1 Tax=Blattabacterium sp. (Blaberus giganteus) TaxID=1186051 RepID=UPI00025F6E24|nr:hypothetical protein [Blattabacterium sp. (Blaberus giganteus)]AFJ90502.1 hypothetical protein BGIGA_046 [Blattabacterium sp. (Blaberus giganteus)]